MAVMGLSDELHARIAAEFYDAERTLVPIQLLSREYPVITFADAYAIQQEGLKLRLAEGAHVVGHKIGITSKGMMELLDCTMPDFGYLLDRTQLPENGSCVRSELHLPMVEGELAFVIGRNLETNFVTEQEVANAIEEVHPCFEICDTRFTDWRITARDTICDNAATARFMVSSAAKKLSEIDPVTIGMTLEKNGQTVGRATGAEVMGSPINSVTWLANRLIEYGNCLKAGDIVLSGSFLAGSFAETGDSYTVHFEGFPPLSLTFV